MLNNNPVLVARNFQCKVGVFFKEIIDSPLGKTKISSIYIEFQERSNDMLILLYGFPNSPNIQNEAGHADFIEKTINAVARPCE